MHQHRRSGLLAFGGGLHLQPAEPDRHHAAPRQPGARSCLVRHADRPAVRGLSRPWHDRKHCQRKRELLAHRQAPKRGLDQPAWFGPALLRALGGASFSDARVPLTCVECGRQQRPGEPGWRAYLTVEEEEPPEALTYCPGCAESEFSADGKPPPST